MTDSVQHGLGRARAGPEDVLKVMTNADGLASLNCSQAGR